MPFLEINPRYRDVLEQHGLNAPEHFLDMPSVVICGHPHRNVARVTLGTGPGALRAFLKREHRIPWRERLRNASAGFGFVSKSYREASMLRAVQQAGIACPEWVAVGEDRQGRGFLLLRELTRTRDLRLHLRDRLAAPADERRRFALMLGEALAGVHNAGFNHRDLYSKHILVNPGDHTVSFLDWQRSRRRRQIGWRRRWRDLAALDATLADELATVRERLICLRAYLRENKTQSAEDGITLRHSAMCIRHLAQRLLRQRRIRELRQVPPATGTQGLIRQNGEALCLTPEFRADLGGQIPAWLSLANLPPQPRILETRTWVALTPIRRALLIRRRENRLLCWLWALLRGRPLASPELRRAGLLFRLERYGIRGPRLLAFGQRQVLPWRVESFLLIEPVSGAVGLSMLLARRPACGRGGPDLELRRRLIREAAGVLRRVHELNCYLGACPSPKRQRGTAPSLADASGSDERQDRPATDDGECFVVVPQDLKTPSVLLGSVDCFCTRRPKKYLVLKDLLILHRQCAHACSRTDELRFLLSYVGRQRFTPAAKSLARSVLRACASPAAARVADGFPAVGRLPLRTAQQGALP